MQREDQVRAARDNGILIPEIAFEAAESAGVPYWASCSLLAQESSGGANVFGHDAGMPFAGAGEVTEAKYLAYKALRLAGEGSQGVGPMQLTFWAYQDRADALGGCWRPEVNTLVGMQIVAEIHAATDDWRETARQYNAGPGPGGEAYADEMVARFTQWQEILDMAPIEPPQVPYVGPGKNSGGGNKPITRIVIHSTVGSSSPGSARSVAAWFRDPDSRGSAHYIIDAAEALQSVWDSLIAWHAPPNPESAGVELCDWPGDAESDKTPVSRWNHGDHARVLQRGAALTARLCLAYDVPIRKVGPVGLRLGRRGICGHVDVRAAWRETSHWDPGNFPWRKFIRMVRAEAKRLQDGGLDPNPEPDPKPEPPEEDEVTPEDIRAIADAILDTPLNVHNPKGRPETRNVTVREKYTAEALELVVNGSPRVQAYLEDARRSRA